MLSEIRPAIVSTILFTLLLGLGYPLAITAISQVAFPYQANGSLVRSASLCQSVMCGGGTRVLRTRRMTKKRL